MSTSSPSAAIEEKLRARFEPEHLEVVDESCGCGARFLIVVVSAQFEGVGLLDRQRAVHECIAEEMKAIHAVQLKTWTPAQFAKKGGTARDSAAPSSSCHASPSAAQASS